MVSELSFSDKKCISGESPLEPFSFYSVIFGFLGFACPPVEPLGTENARRLVIGILFLNFLRSIDMCIHNESQVVHYTSVLNQTLRSD